MTAELKEWRPLETETAGKLEVAMADFVLQSRLWEAAREEVGFHFVDVTQL